MNEVKALVHCSGISTSESTYKNRGCIGALVTFGFNYHNQDESHPNRVYFDATPSGQLQMYINNEQAWHQFETGSDYELILRKIDPNVKQ